MGTDGIVLGPFFSVSAEKGPECSLRVRVVELYLTCACRVHGFRAAAHRQVLWQELERHYIRTQHLIWRVHHSELSTSSQSWFENHTCMGSDHPGYPSCSRARGLWCLPVPPNV